VRRADGSGAQDDLSAGADVDVTAVFEQSDAGDAAPGRGPGAATLIRTDRSVHQELHGLVRV